MSKTSWELWGIIIAIFEFDINYLVYAQTRSITSVLIILVVSLILALAFIVSDIYFRIRDISDNIIKINKRIIRDKELEDIRLDLREMRREVFRKNEQRK